MEKFKKLNYAKLMARNPSELDEFTNYLGQKMVFLEHPTRGDSYPVIVLFVEEKLAFNSGLMDTDDFWLCSDYEPVLVDGVMKMRWEVE